MTRATVTMIGAGIALVAIVVVAFSVGRYPVPLPDLVAAVRSKLTGAAPDPAMATIQTILFNVRGPRVLAALAIGAALAAAGAAYQSLFRNPLVSPDILGVSAGAALGAVIGIFFSLHVIAIQLLAFAFGLAAVGLVYVIANAVRGHDPMLVLVLAGVVVGALLGACVALLKYLADPYNQLPAITFWLLGSLAAADSRDVIYLLPLVVAGADPARALALAGERALGGRRRSEISRRGGRAGTTRGHRVRDARDGGVGGGVRCHRVGGPRHPAFRAHAGRTGVLAPSTRGDPAGRGFSPRRRYACSYRRAYRDSPGCVDGVRRHTALHLATHARASDLAMKLEARNLAFGYGDHEVGRGVSMSVSAGEVVCLLGPNGGGKTTLFKTLLGLLRPQGGAALLDGADVATLTPRQIARSVSYVPQAHEGYFPFSVLDVVLMGRTAHVGLFATPSRQDREHAAAALDQAGIAHLMHAVYTRISGGERQLTLVARALAQEAGIMVLDEPTASLDFGNQVRVIDRIVALAQQGMGVLLSTHNPDHAFACADRVVLLHGGRILDTGPPSHSITRDNLRTIYGVELDLIPVGSGTRPRTVCVPRFGE